MTNLCNTPILSLCKFVPLFPSVGIRVDRDCIPMHSRLIVIYTDSPHGDAFFPLFYLVPVLQGMHRISLKQFLELMKYPISQHHKLLQHCLAHRRKSLVFRYQYTLTVRKEFENLSFHSGVLRSITNSVIAENANITSSINYGQSECFHLKDTGRNDVVIAQPKIKMAAEYLTAEYPNSFRVFGYISNHYILIIRLPWYTAISYIRNLGCVHLPLHICGTRNSHQGYTVRR